MPTQTQIREEITARIVTALENGVMPWRRPWRTSPNAGRPCNVVSKNAYGGVNILLLELAAIQHGFGSKFWATYQQWAALGCQVKKRPENVAPGQWGSAIIFCKPVKKTVEDHDTGEETDGSYFILRYYTLFCADQVAGAERFQVVEEAGTGNAEPDFAPAQELIAATGATIKHGGERAYYSTIGDFIQLPHRERFATAGGYYSTAFHELGHWTQPRLQGDGEKLSYPMEELVVEMSASYVAAELAVPNDEPMENHASYIKSWLDGMKGDASYIFKAAKKGSATTDFLLAFVREPEAVEVG